MHHFRKVPITSLLIVAFHVFSFGNGPNKDQIKPGADRDSFSYVGGNGKQYNALLPKNRLATDYTPIGFTRQPSFVRGAGMLNKGEHAFVLYDDGDLIPQPLMLEYRYGLLYWWDAAVDVGGNAGVFQAFIRTRIENAKTRKSEALFWANELSLGYKIHSMTVKDNLTFDDKSLVFAVDNSVAYRMGKKRNSSFYLLSIFYVDYDLHSPRRQTDYYVMPAILGYESMVGDHASFFVEAGAAYSINGMQFADGGIMYKNSWFPVFRIGLALRTGSSTAVYYTRETMPLSRGPQPKHAHQK
jgi:hypothetical protein